MEILKYVLISLAAYFIGNLSFARIISKLFLKDDITKKGSGNPGAMNMLRSFGVKFAALTLLLDLLKGLIPALIGYFVLGNAGLFVAGACAIFGHCYPVVYKFKGGKGIATALGVFAVASPLWTLLVFCCLIGFILTFEYGGAASILAIAVLVCIEAVKNSGNIIAVCCLIAIFLFTWFGHKNNIYNMLEGSERKTKLRSMLIHKKDKAEKKELPEIK